MSTESGEDFIQIDAAPVITDELNSNLKQLYLQQGPYSGKGGYQNQLYNSQYSGQYSSDSGYSTTTDDQKPKKKKVPHPHGDLVEINKDKDLGIYATLPRKGTQKAALRQNSAKDVDVYHSYLQRQKDAQLKPRQRSDSESSIANLSTAGNHSRQSSRDSIVSNRMSKEEINQHLTDFMRAKQTKDVKKQNKEEKKLQKMLYDDMISMQKRQLNFKDGKQPLPVPPPVVPDTKYQMYKPCPNPSNTTGVIPGSLDAPAYVDHTQVHKMNNQSIVDFAQQMPYGQSNHSRESSASSSHTLKAHSRDNSLSSQGTCSTVVSAQPFGYGVTNPPSLPTKSQSHSSLHQNVTDRRVHNVPARDMSPFRMAPPPNDPGGPQQDGESNEGPKSGVVAQRIAALQKGKINIYKLFCL